MAKCFGVTTYRAGCDVEQRVRFKNKRNNVLQRGKQMSLFSHRNSDFQMQAAKAARKYHLSPAVLPKVISKT